MPKKSTLRLTTRSVAALPVTGKDTVYWDRDFTGFASRTFPLSEVSCRTFVRY